MHLRHHLTILVAVIAAMTVSCGPSHRVAVMADDSPIVILYENDVHCAVDGYPVFAALKNEMKASGAWVTTVSNGDFAQGGSLGASSHGRDIINIMNEVGYDFVTLGNHEFDYGMERQFELMEELSAECLCCNFKDLKTGKSLYKPYEIVKYGKVSIAFVGVSTPYTINSSNPAYFKDENGNPTYSFSNEDFFEVVQSQVDAARKEGADYVVVLSHVGDEYQGKNGINSLTMISNTHGIDVVLDGHSHSVIPKTRLQNDKGDFVLLTSTGTKFQNMGVLTLDKKGFNSRLIDTREYTVRDKWTEKVVEDVKEGYRKVAEQVVFTSNVHLRSFNDERKRIVRTVETNLGDFCTDAFRYVLDTDIALIGGGSIREDLPEGDVTYNDVFTMFPFESSICKAVIKGRDLLDVLEFSVSLYPDEFGGFMQVSGIKFEFDPSIEPSIQYNARHEFLGVEGQRRVIGAWVLDKETGEYEAVNPQKEYTIAASTYLVKDHGDGYAMMAECTDIDDAGRLDTDIILSYTEDYLHGKVPDSYAQPQGRILMK